MGNDPGQRHQVGRALSRLAVIAGLALGGLAVAPASPGATADDPPPSALSLFDAGAVGSIVGFSFHVPEAFFPFQITGGILESTSRATSSPRAFGTAGLAPVPLATSIGLVIPRFIPGTEIPIPDDVQAAFKSIDFTALPNGCQAAFPPVKDADTEAICGGPYQRDAALGFTAAGLNGHVMATGALDEPFTARTVSKSRGTDVTIPGLQATLHGAYSEGITGLNEAGLPQGKALAQIDSLSILGELLHIEGIHSETVVATDGTQEGAQVRSSFTIRAASVFGIPVTIGPDGVAVNREKVPSTELRTMSARVESALAQAGGMRVRLVPAPPVEVRGGEVKAQSGAIEIAYLSQTPTPVDVVQRIAYSRATVNAVPGLTESDVVGEASPVVGIPPESGGSTSTEAAEPVLDVVTPGASGPAGAVPLLGSALAIPGSGEVPPATAAEAAGAGPGASPVAPDAAPGRSASTGRRVGVGESALAVPVAELSPAARVRLKALYGGVAAIALLGFALLPLLRTLVRTPPTER